MNKKYLTYLVLAIAIILVYFGFKKDLGVSAPQINSPVSDNKKYSNEKFGFSFEYSGKYKVVEQNLDTGERNHTSIILLPIDYVPPQGGEGPTAITFDVYQNNLDQQGIEAWIKGNAFSNYKLGDGKLTSLTVDGKDALTYTWDGLYKGQTIVFLNNENIIALSVTFISQDDQILKDFDQVFNSIKLTSSGINSKLPQTLVENYLRANISNLSPQKEVLGGKFYVTEVKLNDSKRGTVNYEDGHITLVADFTYTITESGEVKVDNFIVRNQ